MFPVLRRMTLRISFCPAPAVNINLDHLPGVLSTIASPFFCEFVLELNKLHSQFDIKPSLGDWGRWGGVDKFLNERFSDREDFKVIIRAGKSYDGLAFQSHAIANFPSLASKGLVHLRTSYD